jgi:hypothetical protein
MKTVWLHLIFYHRNRLEINTYMINDYVISIELTCLSKQSLSAMCSQWYLRNTNTTDYETRTLRSVPVSDTDKNDSIELHHFLKLLLVSSYQCMCLYFIAFDGRRVRHDTNTCDYVQLIHFLKKNYQLRHVCAS